MNDNGYVIAQGNVIRSQLVGGTIEQEAVAPDGEFGDANFGFIVRTKSGRKLLVWVLSDPEGNGAGFLDIQEG